ncbi:MULTISPECIES: nucleic acid-binding protein [unclassified Streptomyces]|uniref:nucleic acid-binding protein n=1 Tax=unclassified Streptomyces TaxID=2593676 RepID=UPI0038218976
MRYAQRGGYTPAEQERREQLRLRAADLTAAIITHAFWNDVTGPERLDARSQLKHVLACEDREGQEAA